ncbi:hypothetical protein GCM10010191_05500 [Actinomadura vinacea]|uniref:DhaL domain-containing protein n=1 Tax=Actinomadura vinacea TaxID=115336 RepID=A0ABN3ICX4_9ACTN
MTVDQEGVLRRYAAAVERAHAELTELDRHSGDGDFGDNLRGGLRDALRRYEKFGGAPFAALSEVFLDEVGGTSGPLFGLLFSELARALEADGSVRGWADGTAAGLAAIQRVGEAEVGDRTLVDALSPAAGALREGGDSAFARAAEDASKAAAATADLRARMGRASYVGDRAKGGADPGALGVALLFQAIAEGAFEKGAARGAE